MVKTGLDVILQKKDRELKDLRFGLIVNASSVDARLRDTVTILQDRRYKIICLFAPEHGLWGNSQDQIKEENFYDIYSSLRVFSLYGLTKKPTRPMLEIVDALIFDIQDVGSRYYTFIWTMALAMEAAEQYKKKFIVLDRPNPINGITLEGPVLNQKFRSFVGLFPIPVRHGMTTGELAILFKREFFSDLDLKVIKMRGWQRKMWFDETGLPWIMPSPNMPTLNTAIVYPGMCLLEGTNLSEARGTTRPFEIFGAPWLDPFRLGQELKRLNLPGVCFRPLFFKPTFHKYKNQNCGGLQIYVLDRNRFKPFLTALKILKLIKHRYRQKFAWRQPPYEDEEKLLPFDILAGNNVIRRRIESKKDLGDMERLWQKDLEFFKKKRKGCLLYQ